MDILADTALGELDIPPMCPEMTEMMLGPSMKPVRWDEDQVPVFDSNQIELYGLPEYFGVYKYRVIALRETESPMVSDDDRAARPVGGASCAHSRQIKNEWSVATNEFFLGDGLEDEY